MNDRSSRLPGLIILLLVLSTIAVMIYSIAVMGGLLPEQASSLASSFDYTFYVVYYLALFFFGGVMLAIIIFSLLHYRRAREERPPVIRESKLLELTWVIIPSILVIIVFTLGFKNYVKARVSPPPAYEIKVTGKQWLWQFEYPDGTTSVGELYVPVNRPIRLLMSSTDVIHSFYVPAFRLKYDVLPSRYTTMWFTAIKTGDYDIFCAEYCGTSHSGMLAKLHVVSQEEFDNWLASAGGPPEGVSLAEYGAQLYQQFACFTCHTTDGSKGIGPTFKGLFGKEEVLEDGTTVVVDENYLRESILDPKAKIVKGYPPVMPPYQGQLNDRQITALIEFIKTLQ